MANLKSLKILILHDNPLLIPPDILEKDDKPEGPFGQFNNADTAKAKKYQCFKKLEEIVKRRYKMTDFLR